MHYSVALKLKCEIIDKYQHNHIFSHSTRLLAATTLRNVLGTKNLSEILSERDSISAVMKATLDQATDPWGVRVQRVEVKEGYQSSCREPWQLRQRLHESLELWLWLQKGSRRPHMPCRRQPRSYRALLMPSM